MNTQSILRFTLISIFSTGLFVVASSLSADVVISEKSSFSPGTETTPVQIIQFLEPESTSLLNFNSEQKSAEVPTVLPYSLASDKAQATPIPEPSHWPFLVFCMLIWSFVFAGRRNRTLKPAC